MFITVKMAFIFKLQTWFETPKMLDIFHDCFNFFFFGAVIPSAVNTESPGGQNMSDNPQIEGRVSMKNWCLLVWVKLN